MFPILNECVANETRLIIHIHEKNGGGVMGEHSFEIYVSHDNHHVYTKTVGGFLRPGIRLESEVGGIYFACIKKIEKHPEQKLPE